MAWNFTALTGLQIEGVLVYFSHLKHQKRIGDDVGDFKYIFTTKKNCAFCDETHQF
jgi:hypothetical protein